jgi:hypothetical protein
VIQEFVLAKLAPRILIKKPVLCELNFCHFGCVKAAEIADRKLIRIALIRINLRSLRSTI